MSATASNECVLQPTYVGYIAGMLDKLLLLEACLSGKLHHLPRFPWQRELQHIVRSGNIFIYEETATGVGKWDDGRDWVFIRQEHELCVEREHSASNPLMKKSGRIIHQGVHHYIISYYKLEDTLGGTLKTPSQDPDLRGISLRPSLDFQHSSTEIMMTKE